MLDDASRGGDESPLLHPADGASLQRGGPGSDGDGDDAFVPHVPATESPREVTVRAVVLSVCLSILLAASSAYLGLFAGISISASLPASVASMSILRAFWPRDVHLLENNAVQTSASAGQALTTGAIFTLPALFIIEDNDDQVDGWGRVHYGDTVALLLSGALMGIAYTVPLRRALFNFRPKLAFPEGLACSQVLLAGEEGAGASASAVARAAVVGAGLKLITLLDVATPTFGAGFLAAGAVVYLELACSAALIGVGQIVGWDTARTFLAGAVCNWLLAIPLVTGTGLVDVGDEKSPRHAAYDAYNSTRFLGVGAMAVGGVWSVFGLRHALLHGLRAMTASASLARAGAALPRTERDLPLAALAAMVLLSMATLFSVLARLTADILLAAVLTLAAAVIGFLAASIAGYMAGLVGASQNPVSGVTLVATIIVASLLRFMAGGSATAVAAALYVSCAIASAGSMSADNMQDLYTGYLLGATPRTQQLMLVLGVGAAAMIIPAVLQVLASADGFGTSALPAPQATLMASVATGVIGGGLPWGYFGAGAAAAVAAIVLDQLLVRFKTPYRFPVLAFGVGLYIPLATVASIALGSLIPVFAGAESNEASAAVLAAGGLITGEALTGIFFAILVVSAGSSVSAGLGLWELSVFLLVSLCAWCWWGVKSERKAETEAEVEPEAKDEAADAEAPQK